MVIFYPYSWMPKHKLTCGNIKKQSTEKPENEPYRLQPVTRWDRLGSTCAHCAALKMS